MEDEIKKRLAMVERQGQIKILYACESGSRAWGFESTDSDYDVRFIYIRPTNDYLAIEERRDVIELPINDLLDINGWDVRKALKLFRKSNPPLMEWLESPIVYLEQSSFTARLRELAKKYNSPRVSMLHYLHMAENNYRSYFKGPQVKLKKYLYVLRPLLGCLWIEKYNTFPPMEFDKLVADIVPPGELADEIGRLLVRKRAGEELDEGDHLPPLDNFAEESIAHIQEIGRRTERVNPASTDRLDGLFRATLKEVWGGL